MQADPLGLGAADATNPQSLNLYSYVGNDPANFVDPDGMLAAIPGAIDLDMWVSSINWLMWRHWYFSSGGYLTGGSDGWTESGGEEPEENQEDDCHRFADMVAEIASRNNNAEGFMNEMARTFTAANDSTVAGMRLNADNALPAGRPTFRDSGFKPQFQDYSNQVRHFTGGLIVGYRSGYEVGLPMMDLRELLPGGTMADVRLNEYSIRWGTSMEPAPATVTGYMGAIIKLPAHPGYKGLADLIRRDICQ